MQIGFGMKYIGLVLVITKQYFWKIVLRQFKS